MTDAATETLVITASGDDARAIREGIDSITGTETSLSSRKNLDGNVPAWILIVNVAAQALPHVLTFVKEQLASRRVTKIVFADGRQIENPTPRDLEEFRSKEKSGQAADAGHE